MPFQIQEISIWFSSNFIQISPVPGTIQEQNNKMTQSIYLRWESSRLNDEKQLNAGKKRVLSSELLFFPKLFISYWSIAKKKMLW